MAERHGPPKYTTPVAGGPVPPIPRLDVNASSGTTMAEQAAMQRASVSAPPGMPGGGLFQEGAPQEARMPSAPRQPQAGDNILPTDVLPPEALQDPSYIDGNGARYAKSQPHLAMKYGVLRGGQRVPPQQLSRAQPGLRPETIEALKAVSEAQRAEHPLLDNDEKKAERDAAGGPAGAAARFGNAPGEGPNPSVRLTAEEVKEATSKMDDFEFNTLREQMMKDIINNDEQRLIIEKRCPELSIDDIIVNGYCTQRVPIIPGKLEATYQSMQGDEDLAIKRLIMNESKSIEVSERYLLDKYSLMGLCLGLRAVNGNPMPDHQDGEGNFNEDLFWKKFSKVGRLPFHMLASLGVNYYWFDIRVRKLFVASKLGNG